MTPGILAHFGCSILLYPDRRIVFDCLAGVASILKKYHDFLRLSYVRLTILCTPLAPSQPGKTPETTTRRALGNSGFASAQTMFPRGGSLGSARLFGSLLWRFHDLFASAAVSPCLFALHPASGERSGPRFTGGTSSAGGSDSLSSRLAPKLPGGKRKKLPAKRTRAEPLDAFELPVEIRIVAEAHTKANI